MSLIKLTWLDKDGSLAIPEIAATIGSMLIVVAACRDLFLCFVDKHDFPYLTIGAAISSIVLTLATAQRVRDGLWKSDRDQ